MVPMIVLKEGNQHNSIFLVIFLTFRYGNVCDVTFILITVIQEEVVWETVHVQTDIGFVTSRHPAERARHSTHALEDSYAVSVGVNVAASVVSIQSYLKWS